MISLIPVSYTHLDVYKRQELSDITGESKQEMSGNLNAVGDPVDGTFDTKAKTFEPAVAAA